MQTTALVTAVGRWLIRRTLYYVINSTFSSAKLDMKGSSWSSPLSEAHRQTNFSNKLIFSSYFLQALDKVTGKIKDINYPGIILIIIIIIHVI
jgi:hypothetical protein